MSDKKPVEGRYLLVLALGALGVVYGDIGTSPLYALRECFSGPHALAVSPSNILGVLSLIFWSLVIVISIKYLVFVMRADNHGEGGILSLMALARPEQGVATARRSILVGLGLFGAALLYGDGIITPAISVLSAVEGLKFATPMFEHYVLPVTIVILVALFSIQRRGTAGVGAMFGPVTLLWFIVLTVLGVTQVVREPEVLEAVNPAHALRFFGQNGWLGFMALGSIFLVVTGGEALYADMGHFGARPIRLAWFVLVLPALLANYFGQGALLLRDPTAAVHPFYRMAPPWALLPLVLLATAATVIASQAVISGAFSLTRQAVQMGYCPRLEIEHTSAKEIGQIYIPTINWVLMAATIGLVIGFRSSSNLAAAYGVAVTTTMVLTTLLLYVVARKLWGWSALGAGLIMAFFLAIELAFFGATIVKIAHGGWFPLAVAAFVFTLMATWRRGRAILYERMRSGTLPVDLFLSSVASKPPVRVAGTAVFMSRSPVGVPHPLLHNIKHNKVLHHRVVLLSVLTAETPHVPEAERIEVEPLGEGIYRVLLRYGFMEDPNVPAALAKIDCPGLELEPMQASYFLGRETLLATKAPGMALWREKLFGWMSRNSSSATIFYSIPPNRVVELGEQVEL